MANHRPAPKVNRMKTPRFAPGFLFDVVCLLSPFFAEVL